MTSTGGGTDMRYRLYAGRRIVSFFLFCFAAGFGSDFEGDPGATGIVCEGGGGEVTVDDGIGGDDDPTSSSPGGTAGPPSFFFSASSKISSSLSPLSLSALESGVLLRLVLRLVLRLAISTSLLIPSPSVLPVPLLLGPTPDLPGIRLGTINESLKIIPLLFFISSSI